MAEVKDIKESLIKAVRDGEMQPEQAYASFEKISPTQIRTGRIYEKKSTAGRVDQYRAAKALREKVRNNRIPFITPDFLPDMYLAQGLTLLCGKPGTAKSTTGANVLAGFIKSVPNKIAVVATNEEAADAIYERVACVMLRLNFIAYFLGKYGERERRKVEELIEKEIAPRIEIVDKGAFDMACLEDVQSVFASAADDPNVGIGLLDYYQLVNYSRKDPGMASFEALKKLGLFFKELGETKTLPVVALAQLYETGADLADRIQNDKTVYNHAFRAIEVIPDPATLTTKFKVHKDRFSGHTGKEVVMDFKGGAYEMQGGDAL